MAEQRRVTKTPDGKANAIPASQHAYLFSDLPVFESLMMEGLAEVAPNVKRDFAVLALPENRFAMVSTAGRYLSAEWYQIFDQVKRSGKVFERAMTAEASVIEMLYYSQASSGAGRIAEAALISSIVKESRPIELFVGLVRRCAEIGASDVHIEVRNDVAQIRARLDGIVRQITTIPASMALDALASSYTVLAEEFSRTHAAFNQRMAQAAMIPVAWDGQNYSLRYQSHPTVGGMDAVFRILSKRRANATPLTLDKLGYTPSQIQLLNLATQSAAGGVFVAGVTGSGKTTTLNTILGALAREGGRKIVTIEDPVEYELPNVSHLSIQRGDDKEGAPNPFQTAMNAFLRLDPDIGMLGEIRDGYSGEIAQAAIETGHKVFATVHAASAIGIVARLVSPQIGLQRDVLCSPGFISALIYQCLLPLNCEHCKEPATEVMESANLAVYVKKFGLDASNIFCASDTGCEKCRKPGLDYSDMVRGGTRGVKVSAEVLVPDEDMLALLLEGHILEARRAWRSKRSSGFSDPGMTGKEVWGHALYDISQGRLDPYYFERNFGSIDQFVEFA